MTNEPKEIEKPLEWADPITCIKNKLEGCSQIGLVGGH